jgi:predicted AAA+ superfamily ATPase
MTIDWENTYAAIWRGASQHLRPARRLDPTQMSQLVGIDSQKQALCHNTERYLAGLPANNALLWGARGSGKSSLVKALLNEYAPRGLRVVQVDKADLRFLPEVVDQIRDLPQRFIVYCDDLSFDASDSEHTALKSALDGSIEVPPENVLIYATSNRRHLVPEHMADNLACKLVEGEVHYADAVEEKISLSDRFGLWLSFYPADQSLYLAMVDSYFGRYCRDRESLHRAALQFALAKGARNGRTARQFFNAHVQDEERNG